MRARGERIRRGMHWYDTTPIPPGGDSGLYFVIHRDIDRLRHDLSRYPSPATRSFLIPSIERELDHLTDFLTAYRMDVDRDMEMTLAEINPWLKGLEIEHGKKKR